jgi:cellulose synthase/poly-beta-1,6-N-acetylglucosamine synthase-like glycosyltransferase
MILYVHRNWAFPIKDNMNVIDVFLIEVYVKVVLCSVRKDMENWSKRNRQGILRVILLQDKKIVVKIITSNNYIEIKFNHNNLYPNVINNILIYFLFLLMLNFFIFFKNRISSFIYIFTNLLIKDSINIIGFL